jgi:hypothetical protein
MLSDIFGAFLVRILGVDRVVVVAGDGVSVQAPTTNTKFIGIPNVICYYV